jgi:anthranilate synthase component I
MAVTSEAPGRACPSESAANADIEIAPAADAFGASYAAGRPLLVWPRLVADLETPVSAMLKLAGGRHLTFLLESVEGGATRGRYSIIGLEPDIVWRAFGERAEINRSPAVAPDAFVPETAPPLASLRALLDESRIDVPEDLPPMAAGIFGYMGYDTVRLIERLPNVRPDVLGVPDAVLVRPTVMIIFDTVKDEMTLVTPVRPDAGTTSADAYERARARLRAIVHALDEPLPHHATPAQAGLASPEPVSNTTPGEYMAMVDRAKEYIAAGDAFQIVLAQRFSAPFTLPSFALYRALRRTNPSPFLFHLDFGAFALVGSSPEILVRVRNGEVTIRPLAGTRRRGVTPEEERALEQ